MDEQDDERAEAEIGQNDEQDNATDYLPEMIATGDVTRRLGGMFQNWFLDYASYVILERAVPHVNDGLKPVQRRILHSMRRMDDGRYNKVANIVGHTMQFHPHGDASIGEALVQLGQKDLLIDCQGNWGNILTGDAAAAPRYIEARLSKFALETAFNPKTTEWKLSYDGRNKEPVTLPVKFPLLLAQGVEGIAVGLSSKILPHNLNELCDAAISYLQDEDFKLYPDFLTGGSIDVSRYNDGLRGGMVKVRAKISKLDSKTLVIKEIPYGKTTSSLIDSILKAVEKGKIKIRKIEDNTAAQVEIVVHLMPGVSSDKALDALYAFTDCEVNISPNCCVIDGNKPCFLTVSEVLRRSADNTLELLRKELLIRRSELTEKLHFASLEKIFIEERIYKDADFENAPDMDAACLHIDKRLTPFYPQMVREVTKEDILSLMEIRMARILKFNKDKAEQDIIQIKSEIERINRDLGNMKLVACNWFRMLKQKYGANHPRRTEIRNFDTIVATRVVEANERLFINKKEGFVGTALKKDEPVCNCSDLDDIIIFYRDGTYKIIRVGDKIFIGETEKSKREKHKAEVLYVAVYKHNDRRTVYNVIYRNGADGSYYIKRFYATSLVRDREYDATQGVPLSRIVYFSANHNGEAETVKVTLRPKPGVRAIFLEKDFSSVPVKSRQAIGSLVTKKEVLRINLKTKGISTLGDRKVWFDYDVNRLNYEGRGELLGEFHADDRILVITQDYKFYTTGFDEGNHYDIPILRIEKFIPTKVWCAILYDAEQGNLPYIKRFLLIPSTKPQSFVGNNVSESVLLLIDTPFPRLRICYGGHDAFREPTELDVATYIAVKSFKAKGKRLTTREIKGITELEPTHFPESPAEAPEKDEPKENLDPDAGKTRSDIIDEVTGQIKMFPDDEL